MAQLAAQTPCCCLILKFIFWYFAFHNRADDSLFESRHGERIDFYQEWEGNSIAGAPGSQQCPDG